MQKFCFAGNPLSTLLGPNKPLKPKILLTLGGPWGIDHDWTKLCKWFKIGLDSTKTSARVWLHLEWCKYISSSFSISCLFENLKSPKNKCYCLHILIEKPNFYKHVLLILFWSKNCRLILICIKYFLWFTFIKTNHQWEEEGLNLMYIQNISICPGMLDYMMWPWMERLPCIPLRYPDMVFPSCSLDTWVKVKIVFKKYI